MKFDLITIFPKIFDSYFNESIIKRARTKKKVKIAIHNLRDFALGRHRQVDDRPYGGGAGMLMMVEPVYRALKKIKKSKRSKIIIFNPSGKKFDQAMARKFSALDQLILICPRYEGYDARIKKLVDEEISIGDYVLTGGEIPAMMMVDAVTRLIPGVLGKQESVKSDTFFESENYIKYPQYTRPEVFTVNGKKWRVPPVLLSGDHKKIGEWRRKSLKHKNK